MSVQQIMAAQNLSDAGSTPYFDEVIADGPQSYYRMSGSTLTGLDQGALGINGTFDVGVTLQEPSLCGDSGDFSVYFVSREMVAGSSTDWLYANDFTLEMLIKPASVTGLHSIISFGMGRPFIRLSNTSIQFLRSQSELIGTFSTAVAADVVYHIAVVVDSSGNSSFYLNGVGDGTGTTSSAYGSAASNLHVGSENGLDTFDGHIDEVAIYNTALSSARIAAHAEAAGF